MNAKASSRSWRRRAALWTGLLTLAGIWTIPHSGTVSGQTAGRNSVISGAVTADRGEVLAFRVKAQDTVRRITYTVFTNKGRYQIANLPAGSYQVSAVQAGYESPTQQVELPAAGAKTVDLALKATYPEAPAMALVDFDEYMPPAPGRDIWMNRCSGCHGIRLTTFIAPRTAAGMFRTEEAWRASIGRMFDRGWGGDHKTPRMAGSITDAERETLTKYLADNFGPNSPRRDLKAEKPVYDEDALAGAIFTQYELPNGRSASGDNAKVSAVNPSTIYVNTDGPSIVAMDLNNLEYPGRYREWMLPQPQSGGNYYRPQHALNEVDGRIYWVEAQGSAVGELDPNTGKVTRYPSPAGAAPHTGFADSRGRLWYNSLFAPHVVGMFDTKTKKFVETDPSPSHKGGGYYDVVEGLNGQIYAAGSSNGVLPRFDPKTQKWTDHIPPAHRLEGSAAAASRAPRRLAVDSKGRIWFTMTGANAIGVFDPQTDKFKTYTIPVRYTNPYAIQVDRDDNVWTDLAWTQPETFLGKFDSKTEKFTFYPYPNVRDHNAQLKVDPRRETLWMGSGESGKPRQLTSLKPKGNLQPQTSRR